MFSIFLSITPWENNVVYLTAGGYLYEYYYNTVVKDMKA